MTASSRDFRSQWLGTVDYDDAVTEMESRRRAILDGDDNAAALLLCEHPAVITLGASAEDAAIVAPASLSDVIVRRTRRGGLATYHGPGQLMIYPVVRLRRGLLPLLESIAGAISKIAARAGVDGAEFRRDPAGVWVDERKIAACGVHLRRRVMIHGFALNLSTPPSRWRLIDPCGLGPEAIASLAELGGALLSAREVAADAGGQLAQAVADGAGFELR